MVTIGLQLRNFSQFIDNEFAMLQSTLPILNIRPSPSPFFSSGKADLYLGDAIATVNALPSESVDMIFADPPIRIKIGGFRNRRGIPSRSSVSR
jgi:hypothetical protein